MSSRAGKFLWRAVADPRHSVTWLWVEHHLCYSLDLDVEDPSTRATMTERRTRAVNDCLATSHLILKISSQDTHHIIETDDRPAIWDTRCNEFSNKI